MAKSCSFCNDQTVKERLIVKNGLAWAFPTNIPIVPGHTLVCPIRCVSSFSELTTDERESIFALRDTLKTALASIFNAEGFHYAWNEGEVAGQSVPHFHLHIIPRKPGDAGITEYEPRKFLYRPGSREETPQAELREIALQIKHAIRSL